MEEVKFRAWHKAKKKMYPVVSIHFDESGKPQAVRLLGEKNDTPVDGVELMQATGIYDKNRNEIWNRDIVRCDFWDLDIYNRICLVYYNNGGWCVLNGYGDSYISTQCDDVEIIGNIHENPDLLEK